MKDFKIKISLFFLTPVFLVLLFLTGEFIFINFHLGDGLIWGIKRHKGYYKIIPYGMTGNKSPFKDFPKDEVPTINSRGFRNREFKDIPDKGVIRIVTLGESSTFGYHNTDATTYPSQLEQYLQKIRPFSRIEVINAGVPMLNINSMKNLLKHEIVHYRPRVITLYSSYNDVIDSTYQKNFISMLYNYLYKHSEFGVWITSRIKILIARDTDVGERFLPQISKEEIDLSVENVKKFYFANFQEMIGLCRQNNIRFIFIKQPTGNPQSYLTLDAEFLKLSYKEKELYYKTKLEKNGSLNILESKFYIQRILSQAINEFLHKQKISYVDFTSTAEKHIEWFSGPVHLNATGNRFLAQAIGDKINTIIK
ncbi:MAG: SGNH/GDSL hydrolase family protein [bacterium]|nr:SGNH/GDSL hydrolase family protein [bacterium]